MKERVQTPHWYEMLQCHQSNVKCCEVVSYSYLYHFEPSRPLSLKHSGSDVSKINEGSGLKASGGDIGIGPKISLKSLKLHPLFPHLCPLIARDARKPK